MKNIEITAPVGSIDGLEKIISTGVDAVYVGLKGYSSRPDFADLDLEEIARAVQIAHSRKVRVYVALNACITNEMLNELVEQAILLDNMKVDALILADYGLLYALKNKLHFSALHASTLLGVYNSATVQFLSGIGVKRIVLSSDLFIEEIGNIIVNNPKMEYEIISAGGICFQCNRQCELPHGIINDDYYVACQQEFSLYEGLKYVKKAKRIGAPQIRLYPIIGMYISMGIQAFKIEGRTNTVETICKRIYELKKGIETWEGCKASRQSCVHYISRHIEGLQ